MYYEYWIYGSVSYSVGYSLTNPIKRHCFVLAACHQDGPGRQLAVYATQRAMRAEYNRTHSWQPISPMPPCSCAPAPLHSPHPPCPHSQTHLSLFDGIEQLTHSIPASRDTIPIPIVTRTIRQILVVISEISRDTRTMEQIYIFWNKISYKIY